MYSGNPEGYSNCYRLSVMKHATGALLLFLHVTRTWLHAQVNDSMKFLTTCLPLSVMMLSGWNCTPCTHVEGRSAPIGQVQCSCFSHQLAHTVPQFIVVATVVASTIQADMHDSLQQD